MSSLLRQQKGPQLASYVAATNFMNSFFSYTQTKNNLFQVSYTLGKVTTDSSKTPAGAILRDTGRKLYPGVDEGISTYMISVLDTASGLSGFIDPNAAAFAPYNLNKPITVDNGIDPLTNTLDAGPPVYTNGILSVSSISSRLIPTTNDIDLGSLVNPFRSLYVSSGTIYVGQAKISSDPDGNIQFTNKAGDVGSGGGIGNASSIVLAAPPESSIPLYVAVGNNSFYLNSIQYSRDGYNWSNVTGGFDNGNSGSGRAITYGNNLWVAVGDGMTQYSGDGSNWSNATDGSFAHGNAVTYGNNLWVAVRQGANTIQYSEN